MERRGRYATVSVVVVVALLIVAVAVLRRSVVDDAASGNGSPSPSVAPTPAQSDLPAPSPSDVSRQPDDRPNIILVTTDDMNRSDLRWMPKTRALLQDAGVTVRDFISNHPICCPARAEILTGRYAQNNHVLDNSYSRWGGYKRFHPRGQHVGRWLKDAGYRTALVGKHINGWEYSARREPGWTIFNPILQGIYSPFGLTMFHNGEPRLHRGVYTADLVGRFAVRYINRFAKTDDPFFIWVSQVPPHGMFVDNEWGLPVPAPRHASAYPNAWPPSMSDPSFNEDDVSDKPRWVRDYNKVPVDDVLAWHRARIRSLLSVDEQMQAMVQALRKTGELANTYIFFISDNGLMLGEHRLMHKNKPYEPNLRVPLLVRGPGLPAGVTRPGTFGLVDLAPTFLEIAGASPGRKQDGQSMLPTLRDGGGAYRHYLIQGAGYEFSPVEPRPERKWWWRGVRSRDYVYVRYASGFEEFYDMRKDPAQLDNVAGQPAYEPDLAEYRRRLDRLRTCAGPACQRGGVPAG